MTEPPQPSFLSRYKAPHARFYFAKGQTPESVFGVQFDSGSVPTMHPARVSHPTSSVDRDEQYYTRALQARVLQGAAASGATRTMVTSFESIVPAAYVQVHPLRPPRTTTMPM